MVENDKSNTKTNESEKQMDTVPKSTIDKLRKWKDDFIIDLKNPKLMPLKALMFIIFGANWSLLPFLSLQARALGITGEEVGIIYSFLAIPALIAPPLIGMLADKVGNFKILLCFTTIASALMSLLFIVVPVGRLTHILPERVHASVSCSPFSSSIHIDDAHGCQTATGAQFNMTYTSCYVKCHSTENPELILGDVLVCETPYNCFLNASETLFKTAIDHSSNREERHSPNIEDLLTLLRVDESVNGTKKYSALTPFCPRPVSVKLRPPDVIELCTTKCEGYIPREQACTEHQFIEEFDTQLTFYSHLLIRFFFEFSMATSMPLTEGALVTVVKKYGGDFGLQRVYANLGMMIMTPITGILVDNLSTSHDASSYNIVMYIYCAMKLIGALVIFGIDLDFKVAAKTVTADVWILLQRFEVIAFIISALFAGQLFGIIETFLFWLLEDLGADRTMMGFTVTVGSATGCILLLGSSFVIKRLGYVNTIVAAFLCYIVRFLGYTIINNPWAAMPFEAMEAVTTSLILVTFMGYSAELSTPTTVVTLQGIYQGLYHGVGRATGSMIGGYLIDVFGIIITFRTLAMASGLGGLTYFAAYTVWMTVTNLNVRKQEQKKSDDSTTKIEMPRISEKPRDNPGFQSDE